MLARTTGLPGSSAAPLRAYRWRSPSPPGQRLARRQAEIRIGRRQPRRRGGREVALGFRASRAAQQLVAELQVHLAVARVLA